MPTIKFGKHRGQSFSELPTEYLAWLVGISEENLKLCLDELARRETDEQAAASWPQKIIKAGYRALSKTHHPDAGGNATDFAQLNHAYEQLKKLHSAEQT